MTVHPLRRSRGPRWAALLAAVLAAPLHDEAALGPFGGNVTAVLGHPTDGEIVLVYANFTNSLLRSDDGGDNWSEVGLGLPTTAEQLARAPGSPTDVFTVAGGTIFRSTDDGLTFAPRGGGITALQELIPASDGQGLLVRLSTGLLVSDDGGLTNSPVPGVGVVNDVAFAPSDPDRAYAATDAGLLRSDDGGWTFAPTALTDRYESITVPDYLASRFRDDSHVLRMVSAAALVIFVTIYISAQIDNGVKRT